MPIEIDYREERSGVPDLLRSLGEEVLIKNLEVGDYFLDNVIPAERKTASDFISSMLDGRLKNQLYNLSTGASLSYLFVVGNPIDAAREHKIQRSLYLSSLLGSSYKTSPDGECGRVVTVQVDTDFDFALALKLLREKIDKNEPRLPTLHKVKWSDSDRQLRLVLAFPDIGITTAKNIMEHFKTVKAFISADINQLLSVSNIGPKKAQKIYSIVNEEYLPAEKGGSG